MKPDFSRVHCFEALRNISKTFHEIYTIFKSAAYRKPYWKCLVKYSAHFVPYFSFKQRDTGEIRYFSSFVISINLYHVKCGDGRQPTILVKTFRTLCVLGEENVIQVDPLPLNSVRCVLVFYISRKR